MKTKHVISVSGGKDSTALLTLALARCPRESVIPIFCDTGHEHAEVYEYLDYLESALGVKIARLKAGFDEEIAAKRMFIARDQRIGRDKKGRKIRWTNKAKRRALEVLRPTGNPYLDLCLWKGRFPSRMGQFCTQELKRNIAVAFQIDLIDSGFRVISWQGIRRDESINRRNAKKIERIAPGLWAFRPLVDWSAEQVFEQHRRARVEPNPLYKQGMARVGCMPCINCGKEELRQITLRFPGEISRVRRWESMVSAASKQGFSTLFNRGFYEEGDSVREIFEKECIDAACAWSFTSRGGRQTDMFADAEPDECASSYGLCE